MDNIQESSPKGWGGTTSAMMKHHKKEIDNPWALAHWMKKKDFKSHYKNDPEGTKSKKEPEKKPEKKKLKFKEWLDMRELNEGKKKKKKKSGSSFRILSYPLHLREPSEPHDPDDGGDAGGEE